LAVVAGAGPWMLAYAAPLMNAFLRSSATIFGLSAFLHAVLIMPIGLVHLGLARITGWDVV